MNEMTQHATEARKKAEEVARALADGGDLSDVVAALVHEHRHGPS